MLTFFSSYGGRKKEARRRKRTRKRRKRQRRPLDAATPRSRAKAGCLITVVNGASKHALTRSRKLGCAGPLQWCLKLAVQRQQAFSDGKFCETRDAVDVELAHNA